MADFHDISTWSVLDWYNTGGTRAKKYVQSPENKYYYFKRSQYKEATADKPGKDFKFEFWSEIIAHEVGILLGFDVLKYDIAFDGHIVGCISESMINSDDEQLIEGVKYLQAYNIAYQPENKEHRKLYNFKLIESALKQFKLNRFIDNIVEVLVFDALIGNGDRHQENWAIISEITGYTKALDKLTETLPNKGIPSAKNLSTLALKLKKPKWFAPIYDNGSSLGRELTDQRVNSLLASDEELNKYISKGVAEIHWENEKLSHFDLLKQLLTTRRHKKTVINIIKRVVKKFDAEDIQNVIKRIDIWLPEFLNDYKMPTTRKKLIIKIVTLRFQKLRELIVL